MIDSGPREELAQSDADIFEEAKDRLSTAAAAESENRQNAKYALLFREGQQWDNVPTTSVSEDEPQITVNLTDAMVVRVINNIKAQRPRGKCHPVGDGADIDTAEVISGMGRHIEYRSKASIAYDNAADTAATMGWGYWRMVSEYVSPDSFDQELKILPIFNAFSVYMDNTAMMPNASDALWCIIATKMARTEYKRRYPKADNANWTDVGRDESAGDWESREEIRLAEYFRIREVSEKLYLIRDKQGREFTRTKDKLPSPETMELIGLEVVDKRDAIRKKVEWFQLNGKTIVDRRVLPGTFIPVFRCQGNARDIDGKVMRRGMVKNMMDPARMVNYAEVAKIKRLGLAPKAPWVGAEGQFDDHPEWDNANTTTYSKLVYKPVVIDTGNGSVPLPPPQRQPPAQIEAGFSELGQGMRTNLMAVAGMPNEPDADKKGQVVSGVALAKRQFLSDQAHYQYYDNLTLAIDHTWVVMLEWIPEIYSSEKMQRIIGNDGAPKMVKINEKTTEDGVSKVKNDLSVGKYDVIMDTGPGFETKREEGMSTLMELLNTPMGEVVTKTGADLVIRSMDAPYMQELADRLSAMTPDGMEKVMEQLPPRAQAIVKQLMGEVQQLQQKLQSTEAEMKQGLAKAQIMAETKVHDTTIKAQVAAMNAEAEDRRAEKDTRMKVHGELAREEIRAAASLLTNHVDHAQALDILKKGDANEGSSNSTGQQ